MEPPRPVLVLLRPAPRAPKPPEGTAIGRAALGAVFNVWVRRVMAGCFIIYGVLLGSASVPQVRV